MKGDGNNLERDDRDKADPRDRKFRYAVDCVEQQLNDRWPARGLANSPTREERPLDDVSREGRMTKYLKRPNAPR